MKEISFGVIDEGLEGVVTPGELGFTPTAVWNPSPTIYHNTDPWPLPKEMVIGPEITEETGSRFSPPPFAFVVEDDQHRALVAVRADAGWHRWNEMTFRVEPSKVTVKIDLEGKTPPKQALEHIHLHVFDGKPRESRHELLARGLSALYPQAFKPVAPPPEWWLKPIYCGWGDQVTISMYLEGVGPEPRAVNYCTQGLHERWIRRLDEAGVPFGTILIDHGWSPAGDWRPILTRWPDLKGFIRRQHERGRRVLLWLATWLWDGLADEYCTFVGDRKLCTDPTNPKYMELIAGWVRDLVGPDGYDADGFKIDQLNFCPSYRHPSGGAGFGTHFRYDKPHGPIRQHGDGWGIELLHRLQKQIYDAAKSVKPDALITSSTVHPYFHDTFDMVRLHDMALFTPDIFKAMRARADLARAALPGKPIDADNWIHSDYDMWLRYTCGSRAIGVPCIFFAERFMMDWHNEPATKPVAVADLRRIARAWSKGS
jgi:hypothetical protein